MSLKKSRFDDEPKICTTFLTNNGGENNGVNNSSYDTGCTGYISNQIILKHQEKYIRYFTVDEHSPSHLNLIFLDNVTYEHDLRIYLKSFILVYDVYIDCNTIKFHMKELLSKRKDSVNDKIVYWTNLYGQTCVYIQFLKKYDTHRYRFDIEINGIKYIPHLKIVKKKCEEQMKIFIYSNNTNIPYDEDMYDFESIKISLNKFSSDFTDSYSVYNDESVQSELTKTSLLSEKVDKFITLNAKLINEFEAMKETIKKQNEFIEQLAKNSSNQEEIIKLLTEKILQPEQKKKISIPKNEKMPPPNFNTSN